jgi:hypothetical protein
MQREHTRKVVDITNRQARTYFTQVDQRAPLEKVIRRSLNPCGLIERSPKEPTPIKKMRVHSASASVAGGRRSSRTTWHGLRRIICVERNIKVEMQTPLQKGFRIP